MGYQKASKPSCLKVSLSCLSFLFFNLFIYITFNSFLPAEVGIGVGVGVTVDEGTKRENTIVSSQPNAFWFLLEFIIQLDLMYKLAMCIFQLTF